MTHLLSTAMILNDIEKPSLLLLWILELWSMPQMPQTDGCLANHLYTGRQFIQCTTTGWDAGSWVTKSSKNGIRPQVHAVRQPCFTIRRHKTDTKHIQNRSDDEWQTAMNLSLHSVAQYRLQILIWANIIPRIFRWFLCQDSLTSSSTANSRKPLEICSPVQTDRRSLNFDVHVSPPSLENNGYGASDSMATPFKNSSPWEPASLMKRWHLLPLF